MENERAAAIGRRQNGLFLISDHVRVAMMPWRLMGTGQSIAAAECQNGRERDDGSHQHGPYPFLSQPPSTAKAADIRPEHQFCHIRA